MCVALSIVHQSLDGICANTTATGWIIYDKGQNRQRFGDMGLIEANKNHIFNVSGLPVKIKTHSHQKTIDYGYAILSTE